MELVVLLAVSVILASLPYATRRRLLSRAGPRSVVAMSFLCLVGLAVTSVVLLIAVIDPSDVVPRAIPAVVRRCAESVGEAFAHPKQDWPRIAATALFLGILARLAFVLIVSSRAHKRLRQLPDSVAGSGRDVNPAIRVIDDDAPVAYTTGLVRSRVIVSTGLLNALDPSETVAVLCHELAHVRGRHTSLLFIAGVIERAFSFLPPMKRAADELILSLEVAADEAAAQDVGDPLLVARALASCADFKRGSAAWELSAGESDVLFRARHLTDMCREDRRLQPSLWASAVVTLALSMFLVQLAALPASAQILYSAADAKQAHHVCHLTHGQSKAS